MAAMKRARPDELLTLVVDVRHRGELFNQGIQLLGSDELVKARPELFARFDLGYREVIAARERLAVLEREEFARQQAAAAPPPAPTPPHRVVCVKRLLNPGVGPVEPGSVLLATDTLVVERPDCFVALED